jgi:hypothetical protein
VARTVPFVGVLLVLVGIGIAAMWARANIGRAATLPLRCTDRR